jgi:acyl-homoserine-lactone acylase
MAGGTGRQEKGEMHESTMKKLALILAVAAASCAQPASTPRSNPETQAWQRQARNVTIIRDDWGIAHIHGRTDADAVFGMVYAQAEDDFNRVETNYLVSLGRLSEAEGEKEIYRDLRQRLFINDADLRAQYGSSPMWLRALMDGWASGLNYYLATHPTVKPRVITRFEPWMALSFSEGSIGGDIERVNLAQLEAFYGNKSKTLTIAHDLSPPDEPTGSNGIAIAPSNTAGGHALLLINPHTSFFFRSELQVSSDEGLDAYGAVTWGQFFIYQGFNEGAGWMHTSSSVDNIDEYVETVAKKDDGFAYKYGAEERPVIASTITVPYKTDGGLATRSFTVYRTHHGPVVREADGKWVTIRLMQEPVKALTQSYLRTKARNYAAFRTMMELHANSSNNTVFADSEGNIAYFHSNFVPKRDPKFDWTKPVDGSIPATEWGDVYGIEESPHLLNPSNGWIQNTNNWPFSAAGANSPRQKDYPAYMDSGSENPRGVHAIRILDGRKGFTLETLIAGAYDSFLTEFAIQVPLLLKAYDQTPASSPYKKELAEQISELRDWDYRWSLNSVPTSLAVFWGEDLWQRVTPDAQKAGTSVYEYMRVKATAGQRLESLAAASAKLTADFGTWKTPWGEINRFQRLTDDIAPLFNDAGPSIPVSFTSARWGSLASFGARAYPNTRKWYGSTGNSFVTVVEFGKTVRARAVTAGGESGDPASPHFNDQAARYATGNLREVYFYPALLEGHIERRYMPGETDLPATVQ